MALLKTRLTPTFSFAEVDLRRFRPFLVCRNCVLARGASPGPAWANLCVAVCDRSKAPGTPVKQEESEPLGGPGWPVAGSRLAWAGKNWIPHISVGTVRGPPAPPPWAFPFCVGPLLLPQDLCLHPLPHSGSQLRFPVTFPSSSALSRL